MRSLRVFLLVSFAVCFFTHASQAQKFQEPTKEELQMTADPKAPGAPAVYLFRESITDNFNHFVNMYARIKVLTEAGKEWANVEVPFGGAPPQIEGRTIHADGTVTPLNGAAVDLLKVRNNRQNLQVRVFSLPSVEVGSILEYRWTIHMGDSEVSGVDSSQQGYMNSALASEIPYWDMQEPIPIRKEHFYWNPLSDLERNVAGSGITHTVNGERANYLLFSARLPVGVKLVASPHRDYDLVLTDVPAFRHEENAPPETGLAYNVRFFYSPFLSATEYWSGEGKRWSKEMDHAAESSDALRAAAAQITAGAATDDDKAIKLYNAVQALDNTSYSKGEMSTDKASTPEQTWNKKSGTRNQIALLYLSLARAAGLQASAMLVTDRSERIFDAGLLSLDQLDAGIVVLHINGKDVYTDPGEKFMPYGQLAWKHQLSSGLLETATGTSISTITPPGLSKDAVTGHTADLSVDAEGGVTGTVKLLMNGPSALQWRQSSLMTGEQETTQRLNATLPTLLPQGISGEVTGVKGLATSAGFLEVTVKVSGKLGSTVGKRVLVPAFFFSTGSHAQFASTEQRQFPVDMHYAEQVIDDVVYHAPAGYTVEGQPEGAQIPWPEHGALVIKTQPVAGGIDVKRIFARVFVMLEPQEYASLRDFYGKVAAADQQQVVFAAGN